MIASGSLGHTIDYQDKNEFGELASHFNAMSLSLKKEQANLEEEITERKKSESALRESEERYALAARGKNDGIWNWDMGNNRIHYSAMLSPEKLSFFVAHALGGVPKTVYASARTPQIAFGFSVKLPSSSCIFFRPL